MILNAPIYMFIMTILSLKSVYKVAEIKDTFTTMVHTKIKHYAWQ